MKRLKPSQFLLLCAEALDGGNEIPPELRARGPDGWHEWIVLTLPDVITEYATERELSRTRPMRFILAAAMAADAGH